MKKIVLICNLNFYKQGHHIFYQNILFEKVNLFEKNNREYYFLFNNSSAKDSIINMHKNTLFLNDEENQFLENHRFSLGKYFSRWSLVKKYAKKVEADEVFLMDFYEPAVLPIIFSHFPFKVSGILFRPYNRIIAAAKHKRDFKLLINGLKRGFLMKILSFKERNIKKMLVLNDHLSINYLNKRHSYNFEFFPDPISKLNFQTKEEINLRVKYNIKQENKIFLVFGALSEVKNIKNLILAFKSIDAEIANQSTLLIMGRGLSGTRDYSLYLSELEKSLKENHPDFNFILEYSYIEEKEHASIFSQVDFVYLAYKDFYFSSATLGIAAKARKYSIVPDYGPMADLSKEYNLGIPVNPDSIEEIKNGILYCINNHNKLNTQIQSDTFCEYFNYENFSKAILT